MGYDRVPWAGRVVYPHPRGEIHRASDDAKRLLMLFQGSTCAFALAAALMVTIVCAQAADDMKVSSVFESLHVGAPAVRLGTHTSNGGAQ